MNIVILGNVPLATWVVERLRSRPGVNVIGTVSDASTRAFSHHGIELPGMFQYALDAGIPIFTLDDLPTALQGMRNLIGISCRFPHIIRRHIINLFDHGIVNLHGGELPRFRGVNIANHAILENVTKGAGTLHFIDLGVDTGPIIDREYFQIEDSDTAYDVFLKTQDALMTLFDRNLDSLVSGTLRGTPQQDFVARGEITKVYKSGDLASLRRIPTHADPEDVLRVARAFTFPGHEPAYYMINGQKVFVTVGYGSRAQTVLQRIASKREQ